MNTNRTAQITSIIDQRRPLADKIKAVEKNLLSLVSTNVYEAKGRVGVGGTEAVAGPESLRSFLFGLGKKAKPPSLQIRFRDYPGVYHEARASAEEKKFVKELLSQSAAVLIAIDAPALMERNGNIMTETIDLTKLKTFLNLLTKTWIHQD